MNGVNIKGVIYLLFIATIFYFIVGKIFKIIKFNKMSKLGKGVYFSIFILLFYFIYKVVPVLLFGNSKITEGMSLADSLSGAKSSESDSSGSSGNIDYTKGWDTADNFRANYCSKTPIFVEQNFFDDRSKEMGNSQGGLIYGGRSELYDSTTKEMNDKFVKELMKQINNGNKVDSTSFTKDNGCITNISLNKDSTGTMSQMCNPKCNFKFTGASK
jgi:hypothetical protein